jgi:uracil-DNA glycosylase
LLKKLYTNSISSSCNTTSIKTMEQVLQNISPEWLDIIYKGETKTMLNKIYECLEIQLSDDTITPKTTDWFYWCRVTPLTNIKAIVLGQDVYPTKGHAHGLSFSCLGSIPKSLRNIYKCLIHCGCINQMPDHGDLTTWAEQGVLMLNIGLTTIIKKAGAHLKLWETYTRTIIERICEYHYEKNQQLVFMLWGNFAKKFKNYIDDDFHVVLEWLHPSPLAQNIKNKKLKFINCNHFIYVNEFLKSEGDDIINWNSINPTDLVEEEENLFTNAESILGMGPTHHIAFTDGGAHPNNKSKESRAGWASFFVSGPFKDRLLYGNLNISEQFASNIRAEGYAIIRVMELIDECTESWDKVTIITDCMFWVDMIEKYMRRWKKETFEEKSNPDLTKRMWEIYNKVSRRGEVNFMHVRSHNKDGWREFDDGTFEKFCYDQNDYVDKTCNYARTNMNPSDEVITYAEYN